MIRVLRSRQATIFAFYLLLFIKKRTKEPKNRIQPKKHIKKRDATNEVNEVRKRGRHFSNIVAESRAINMAAAAEPDEMNIMRAQYRQESDEKETVMLSVSKFTYDCLNEFVVIVKDYDVCKAYFADMFLQSFRVDKTRGYWVYEHYTTRFWVNKFVKELEPLVKLAVDDGRIKKGDPAYQVITEPECGLIKQDFISPDRDPNYYCVHPIRTEDLPSWDD